MARGGIIKQNKQIVVIRIVEYLRSGIRSKRNYIRSHSITVDCDNLHTIENAIKPGLEKFQRIVDRKCPQK